MKKLKILICCPGSWSAGLNSPERGEGRWSQNWAKLLGKAGHEVFAWSAGFPNQPNEFPGVTLINERETVFRGPYDIYIDPCWWADKIQNVKAEFYFRVHWGFEAHLKSPDIPKNHCIIFPYEGTGKINFLHADNPHIDRTFFMPIPLRGSMAEPAFDRKDILFPTHASPSVCSSPDVAKFAVDKIYSYIDSGQNFNCHWLFGEQVKTQPYVKAACQHKSNTIFYPKLPYNQVVNIIDKCRLAVQLSSCSCAIDSVVSGVPFVPWQRGGFFTEVADELGLRISMHEETQERIESVIDTLMTDRNVYTEYVKRLQSLLRGHTEDKALELFNHIVDTMDM